MIILCTVDITTREVTIPSGQRIASYDHNVNVIRFQVETISDFSLDTSSIKIAAQGPNHVRHDYAVDPSTVAIEEETGYITFDWPIPAGVTEMPIGSGFKYGDRGQLIFAVCAEIISGSTVSKAWHSDDGIITVVAHLEPEAGGGEDPEEEATNAQKIAQLQTDVAVMGTQISALGNGSPTPVATVAEMTDESAVYLYTGSETGYTAGNWYYYDGTAWTSGGTYGGAVTDTTLSISGKAADAKAVGDALADKADSSDVTALETAVAEKADADDVTALDGMVSDLKSAFDNIETAFVIGDEPLTLSNFTRGKFITANGTEDTLSNVEYASAIIDESAVGKQLLISGSAWYSSVKPYVFVASNDAKQVADVPNPGSAPTQHTDIPFTPNTTGTLYLNRYNNTTNNVQVAKAIYKVLTSIKGDYLPDDVGDYVYDATNYTGINFETFSNKMLKGTTGLITDESNSNYRVTEYIDIHMYSKLMITACNFYSYGLYSFYDSNKTYISNSGKDAASGSTVTKIYNETVNVPDGAKYIVIGFLYNHMATPYLFGAVNQSILPSKGWDGLKWVCIGDSLTAYNDATAFHYFDYIRADSGIDVINMGVGGTGYMRGADNSNAFYQRVLSITNDCDVCTVFGSGNDLSLYESIGDYTDTGTTTICGCVNTFLDNYFSICPTAPIGIIAPTPWMSYPTTMVANNRMDDYVEKLQKIANYRGVPFLDLYHGSNLRPENETNRNACFYNESSLDGNGDGVHPNELGHRIIAPKIYEFLKTLLLD